MEKIYIIKLVDERYDTSKTIYYNKLNIVYKELLEFFGKPMKSINKESEWEYEWKILLSSESGEYIFSIYDWSENRIRDNVNERTWYIASENKNENIQNEIVKYINNISINNNKNNEKIVIDNIMFIMIDFINYEYSNNLLLDLIIKCFITYKKIERWNVIYDFIKTELGGYKCFISGEEITKELFEGRIRSCVEEHSSDSRQHYFRNGVLQKEGWRLDLFENKGLRKANEKCEWKPYSPVRSNKHYWSLNTNKNKFKADINQLIQANTMYIKKNVRRGNGKYDDQKMYNKTYNKLIEIR